MACQELVFSIGEGNGEETKKERRKGKDSLGNRIRNRMECIAKDKNLTIEHHMLDTNAEKELA